ncbi:PUA-like domain-containing protein, partial [Talaromyces proteolyticus]
YAVISLLQCRICSLPMRTPLRLPCGNTICRACLPPVKKREGISYPTDQGREEGFLCPWEGRGCGSSIEHSMGDCGVDVTVSKIMDVLDNVLANNIDRTMAPVQMQWTSASADNSTEEPLVVQEATLLHGRYLGTYKLMKEGGLQHDIDNVTYRHMNSEDEQKASELDRLVVGQLRRNIQNELDCQVCYGLMVDPLTSSCGHTFCRRCVARVLDHSNLCPICRRKLSLPPALMTEPINRILDNLISNLYPEEIESRRAAMLSDNVLGEDKDLPLFVCTLSFPSMPTFLHVFEPRYRLMIRRALEDGGRRFGMVINNYTDEPQGNIGQTQFMQYGTVLSIDRFELLPDGRSLLSAVGVNKFRIVDWGILDGYYIAKTERVDDISLAQEEDLERREMAAAATSTTVQDSNGDSSDLPLEALSTQQLMQLCMQFIERRRAESAPWLHQRILMAYGQPPSDLASFPYWFASVLPIADEEKYLLLPSTSVRDRLKIAARWTRKLDRVPPPITSPAKDIWGASTRDSVMYITQTIVIGAIVFLLLARFTGQLAQVVRLRRREA